MGYRPDAMLSALAHYRRSSKTQPIAAGIAWINFWPEPKQLRDVHEFNLYWQGALTEAELAGYRLEEFHLSNDMPARRLEQVLRTRNVRGILIPPARHDVVPDWGNFQWENFCVVRFGQTIQPPKAHLVTADQFYDSVLAYDIIRQNGYQRIGLVTTRVGGKRLRFLAGYLSAQTQDTESRQLLPLLFPDHTDQENLTKLVAWMKTTKPDAIITDLSAVADMLARAGYRVPKDIGLAATSVVDGYADAGIYQNSDEIGRAAIQLLVSLIHHNEFGIPRVRREILVEGEWVDGRSLPPRNAVRPNYASPAKPPKS
jgi:DNA-binding LacI/PurR family transcriptional regulator